MLHKERVVLATLIPCRDADGLEFVGENRQWFSLKIVNPVHQLSWLEVPPDDLLTSVLVPLSLRQLVPCEKANSTNAYESESSMDSLS